ncbi:MAG: hypothetical protein EA404_02460 [Spirochaetaceae bacterium]|nr:MAG: hypothetical protein EA404_02460 [Spirochaetaceae bacterium]
MKNMKPILNAAAIMLFTAGVLFPLAADTVTLQNDEDAPFFFTVVQRQSDAYERLTASLAGALAILRDTAELEQMVPPGGVSPLLGSRHNAYLVGVFVRPGQPAYPVAAVEVDSHAGTIVISRKHVLLDEAGQQLSIRPWHARIGDEPIILDNRYLDWEPHLPLVRFAQPIQPAEFVLQTEDGRDRVALSRSHFWGRGGTQLDTVKAVAGKRAVYLKLSSHSQLTPGMSLFLFFYRDGRQPSARYTVEIPITDGSGWVLLWTEGSDEPRVIGNYVSDRFLLEAQMRYDLVPQAILGQRLPNAFADIATGFSGAGRHEEFYHARIYLSSIDGL